MTSSVKTSRWAPSLSPKKAVNVNWFCYAFRTVMVRALSEDGQTMAEYAILVTVIAVVVLAAAVLLGNSISSLFSSLAQQI